ncbi:MAG: OadG family protein [Clostridia bacterium]
MNFANSLLSSALNPTKVSVVDSILIALIGMAIVFAVLIVLMLLISAFGWFMQNSPKLASSKAGQKYTAFKTNAVSKIKSIGKKKEATVVAAPIVTADVAPALAAGTCGELTLIKTTERDAAMIMAIVADATETPLNELRFISIKNVSEGEIK